jgi:hypothetical protein
MAKAGKKHTHRATKPPLPDEQQEAEAKTTAERLRPFTKQLREDYERTAAEAAEMVKAREAVDRMIRPTPAAPTPAAPAPAPTPTPAPATIAPLKWVEEEIQHLKAQGVIYAGIGKHKLARELEERMQAAKRAGRVDKSWSVGHMANELSERGLWPVD